VRSRVGALVLYIYRAIHDDSSSGSGLARSIALFLSLSFLNKLYALTMYILTHITHVPTHITHVTHPQLLPIDSHYVDSYEKIVLRSPTTHAT
jgi:hypothetical protein